MGTFQRTHTDPEGDKRRALRHAGTATRKRRQAEAAERAAMRFAKDTGASLREIAEATGVPHMTVKRIIERDDETAG